jgi:poly(A) polymerase
MIINISSTFENSKHLEALFRLYRSIGSEVRLVGGCVRDTILSIPGEDIDLATPLLPDQGVRLLKNHGIPVKTYGLSHGTITAILDNKPYEITTLRQDVKTFGRHAEVEFGTSWEEDALRRDFTMNAMYLDDAGYIYDYFNGIKDAQDGLIRFVGDAEKRIPEDFLRILRCFRFFAFYGKRPLAPETVAACCTHAEGLQNLSRERIRKELIKTLMAPDPYVAFHLMHQNEISKHLCLGEFSTENADLLQQLTIKLPSFYRLLSLFPDLQHTPKPIAPTKKETHFADLLKKIAFCEIEDPIQHRKWVYLYGSDISCGLYMIKAVEKKIPPSELAKTLKKIQEITAPPFPLKGRDLAEILPPGKALGELLSACEAWWITQSPAPPRQECFDWIKKRIDSNLV